MSQAFCFLGVDQEEMAARHGGGVQETPPRRTRVGVWEAVRTPLVRLEAFEPRPAVELYAKIESANPGGSVKDRAAAAIVGDAIRRGRLGPGRILLDATSGNTGIAYARLGAREGFAVKLCVPANVTPERLRLLRVYGADLVLTDPMDGSDGAIREARRLAAAAPDRYFYADQYGNDANWRAHFETTGVEVLADLERLGRRATHFVAGLGTTGTFVGTGRRLRASGWPVALVAVEPASPLHGLEGLKHLPSAIVPPIYDARLADRTVRVSTEAAHALVRRLARDMGLFVGPSSGAALAACLDVAGGLDEAVIVTVFPDGGDRYLSEPFWTADGPTLALPAEARAAIRAHGAATYPDECCGVLLGPQGGVATDALPLDNATTLERRRRFLVGPDEYRRAEAAAADRALDIVGFYHSHPDHPAEPSAFDLAHAWPNLSYAIVSVREAVPRELRSWRLRHDRSGYDEESLV
jgi:cysteine synthase B